ncbi:BTAD domain-containing putative transcriptional regulator [Streptomyces sp. NPDC048290]|uniref:BTAD domain-containing putative transcriptional regulator n=1 Tax=Streptomyces sp. NPDC048290 TaxID=3155811 RepID=UPI003446F68A
MRFQLLGLLSISDGEHAAVLQPSKPTNLLAALLIHSGAVVSTDYLLRAVWDTEPPATARAALQSCVLRLRRIFARYGIANDTIEAVPGGYRMRMDRDTLDLLRFRDLVRAAGTTGDADTEAYVLREALALWHGPVLANVASQLLHRDEAPRLTEERLRTLERLCDIELARGRCREVLSEVWDAARRHPERERFAEQLIEALYRTGRQTEALVEIRAVKERLKEEFGIDPGAALQRLELSILRGEELASAAGGGAAGRSGAVPRGALSGTAPLGALSAVPTAVRTAVPLPPGAEITGGPATEPAVPDPAGITAPGFAGTTAPGFAGSTAPGPVGPASPGHRGPATPGHAGPVTPAAIEPATPGHADHTAPGTTAPVSAPSPMPHHTDGPLTPPAPSPTAPPPPTPAALLAPTPAAAATPPTPPSPAPAPAFSPPAPSTPPAPTPLPLPLPPVPRFTGRRAQLAVMQRALTASGPDTGPVVISGAPGIGKSALARQAAHLTQDAFPGGCLILTMTGADGSPLSAADALERLSSPSRPGRRLLVLDDVTSAEQIRPLLPPPAVGAAVVTSRRGLAGLVATHGGLVLRLDTLDEPESYDLLVATLGAERVGREPDAARELARICGHFPLGLRIAAARLLTRPGLGLADCAAWLAEDAPARLALADEPLMSVPGVFDAALGRLDPALRTAFVRLAAAPDGTGPPPSDEVLERLADAGFVEEGPPEPYRIHALFKIYARRLTATT